MILGSIDYQNESREGYSNWVDDLIINDKTAVRVKITETKEGDVNDRSTEVLGNLYYMEFQTCDFYTQVITPSSNMISVNI